MPEMNERTNDDVVDTSTQWTAQFGWETSEMCSNVIANLGKCIRH